MARDTGFLTESQRKYLVGEKDLENHSNKWEFKKRIRKRINGSFEDLQLLRDSPYWKEEDFAKVARESRQANTGLLEPMDDSTIEKHLDGVESQSRIYGDAVQEMVNQIQNVDIDGSWQNSENVEKEVQEVFIRNITNIMTDVIDVVSDGEVTDDVTEEIFVDVWPEKERALEIVKDELSNG